MQYLQMLQIEKDRAEVNILKIYRYKSKDYKSKASCL